MPNSFFDSLPSKTSFWVGFVTAILVLGTLGFILLGNCVLEGSCALNGIEKDDNKIALDDSEGGFAIPDDTAEPEPAAVPSLSDDDHLRGDKNAPITIIEYSDFECPFCGRFHPTMQQVMTDYSGKVRWVLRHYPLSFHPEALPAANAAECASEQNKFWEYADKLFEKQDSLSKDYYKQLATELGLNVSQWQTCFDNSKYSDKIEAQYQGGVSAGVTGTPGSFIIDEDGNAIPIKGALPYSSVSSAIDQLLAK
ncbi:DsbA family protein [Candidatus Uhrbacteria bacterium]|nr:DsbA family protein [Candidatus Uhrbacteria bacterium]